MLFDPVQRGGALYVRGPLKAGQKVELSHCSFRRNNALKIPEAFRDTLLRGCGGAGYMLEATGAEIKSSTFSDNRAVCLQAPYCTPNCG